MRGLIVGPLLVGTLLAAACPSSAQGTDEGVSWNREAAAAYLDRRMDEWFAKGERLRTDDGWTTCVSCHTVIPYALARPALRREMGIDDPTRQEARLFDETSRRVRTFDTHQLLYEWSDEMKDASRGTEAVLYALILAAADSSPGRREADGEATRRAFRRLWETQRADGAWEWLDVGIEPFESIDAGYQGAAFAALAVGLGPGGSTDVDARAGLDKLQGYLRTQYPSQNLHNRVWGLLASSFVRGVLTRADRDQIVRDLARRQDADGGWALEVLGEWRWDRTVAPYQSPGPRDMSLVAQSDGYATGLVVYSLRRAGLSIEHPLVRRGLHWLGANQRPVQVGADAWPAWRAHSLNFDREHGGAKGEPWRRLFMSDAATAFAALALSAPE